MSAFGRTLLLSVLLAVSSTGVAAQSTVARPSGETQRKAHFADGSTAAAEHRWLDAVEHFERARAIRETSGTVFNLAVAQMHLDRHQRAITTFHHYLAMPTTQDKPERRALAGEFIEAMGGVVAAQPVQPATFGPRHDARPQRPTPSPRLRNRRDGDARPVTRGGARGAHASVTPGSDPDASALRARRAATPRTASPVTPDEAGTANLLPWVLIGTGGVLAATAVVTGIYALQAHDELNRKCQANSCAPELKSLGERGDTLAAITDVLWVTGAVAAGAGLTLLLMDTEERTTARLHLAPGGVFVEGSF